MYACLIVRCNAPPWWICYAWNVMVNACRCANGWLDFCEAKFYFIGKAKQSWGLGIPMSIGVWYAHEIWTFEYQWHLDCFCWIVFDCGLPMNTGFWKLCQRRLNFGFGNVNERLDFSLWGCQWKIRHLGFFWLPMKDCTLVYEGVNERLDLYAFSGCQWKIGLLFGGKGLTSQHYGFWQCCDQKVDMDAYGAPSLFLC